RLRHSGAVSFRTLVEDAPDRLTVVCRFLALLELFREAAVAFEQLTPLGELTVRWTGSDEGELNISDEFDVPQPAPGEEKPPGDSPPGEETEAAPDQAVAPEPGDPAEASQETDDQEGD